MGLKEDVGVGGLVMLAFDIFSRHVKKVQEFWQKIRT